jgi:plastocyanin
MKKAAVALLFVLAALALAACGGSDSSSSESSAPAESTSESGGGEAEGAKEGGAEAEGGSAGSAASVDFEAAASGLEFTTDFDEAEAGKVTVNFTNPQPVPHDVAIETENGEVLGQTEELTEGSDSTTIDLKPGTYTYFCTVPGHREAGMEGTLTVK